MEVYEIVFIVIFSVLIMIAIIYCIDNATHTPNIHLDTLQLLDELQIPKVKAFLSISPTLPTEDQIARYLEYKDYLDSKIVTNMQFYEYKIENTYFPNVINEIIKDYIHYRLIRGYGPLRTYELDYPYKIILGNHNSISNNLYTDSKFYFNTRFGFETNTLEFEEGFEIDNRLDIKVQ